MVCGFCAFRVDVNHGTAVIDIIVEKYWRLLNDRIDQNYSRMIQGLGIPHLQNIVEDFVH